GRIKQILPPSRIRQPVVVFAGPTLKCFAKKWANDPRREILLRLIPHPTVHQERAACVTQNAHRHCHFGICGSVRRHSCYPKTPHIEGYGDLWELPLSCLRSALGTRFRLGGLITSQPDMIAGFDRHSRRALDEMTVAIKSSRSTIRRY